MCLLDPDLLEVNKPRASNIQHKASAVLTHGILADSGLSELELLFHIRDDSLTLKAQESAHGKFRVHRMGTDNLASNA